jgi:hypothetical protein
MQTKTLIELIKSSFSLDNEERNYWLEMVEIMNEEQKDNLYDIFRNEAEQLERINNNYLESIK